ncbi:type IV pilus modification PilV family protein [Sphingobacterium sp. LRF_L2]|uniref:type IV pilus modification PilV family protein n=1 Tax=Sphingobacterium sp. LRF_L2 TaxID=3369421 RepID=UPI003F5FE6EE
MVKVTSSYRQRLKASTLVEVLIALVILLTVFALGMLIFARLNRSALSNTQQVIQFKLQQISLNYDQNKGDEELFFSDGHIQYIIEEEELLDYKDRKKVKFYAFDTEQEKVIDSLVKIIAIDEE